MLRKDMNIILVCLAFFMLEVQNPVYADNGFNLRVKMDEGETRIKSTIKEVEIRSLMINLTKEENISSPHEDIIRRLASIIREDSKMNKVVKSYGENINELLIGDIKRFQENYNNIMQALKDDADKVVEKRAIRKGYYDKETYLGLVYSIREDDIKGLKDILQSKKMHVLAEGLKRPEVFTRITKYLIAVLDAREEEEVKKAIKHFKGMKDNDRDTILVIRGILLMLSDIAIPQLSQKEISLGSSAAIRKILIMKLADVFEKNPKSEEIKDFLDNVLNTDFIFLQLIKSRIIPEKECRGRPISWSRSRIMEEFFRRRPRELLEYLGEKITVKNKTISMGARGHFISLCYALDRKKIEEIGIKNILPDRGYDSDALLKILKDIGRHSGDDAKFIETLWRGLIFENIRRPGHYGSISRRIIALCEHPDYIEESEKIAVGILDELRVRVAAFKENLEEIFKVSQEGTGAIRDIEPIAIKDLGEIALAGTIKSESSLLKLIKALELDNVVTRDARINIHDLIKDILVAVVQREKRPGTYRGVSTITLDRVETILHRLGNDSDFYKKIHLRENITFMDNCTLGEESIKSFKRIVFDDEELVERFLEDNKDYDDYHYQDNISNARSLFAYMKRVKAKKEQYTGILLNYLSRDFDPGFNLLPKLLDTEFGKLGEKDKIDFIIFMEALMEMPSLLIPECIERFEVIAKDIAGKVNDEGIKKMIQYTLEGYKNKHLKGYLLNTFNIERKDLEEFIYPHITSYMCSGMFNVIAKWCLDQKEYTRRTIGHSLLIDSLAKKPPYNPVESLPYRFYGLDPKSKYLQIEASLLLMRNLYVSL
ncbi:MAG: hypothetical protein ACYSSI_10580 [Planctomycetota bacterium]